MECALVALAMKAGFDPQRLREEFHRIDEVPFDAGHRFMATVHHHTEGEPFLLLKGAPEKIVAMCAAECRNDGTQLLDQADWLQRAHALAARSQRVIAIATKTACMKRPDRTSAVSGKSVVHTCRSRW